MNNDRRDEILLEIYGDMKKIHEKVETMERNLTKVTKSIYGNGVPGLLTRTSENETKLEDLSKHIDGCQANRKYKTQLAISISTAVIAAIAAAIAYFK